MLGMGPELAVEPGVPSEAVVAFVGLAVPWSNSLLLLSVLCFFRWV